jgi:hypothetical protein
VAMGGHTPTPNLEVYWKLGHDFHDRAPTIGRFAAISRLIVKSICLIFLKLWESDFLLYATRFSIVRSLVKRLGMGLPKTSSLNFQL